MKLLDSHNRQINYLRISLTDRCNFNCFYCKSDSVKFLNRREILTIEEVEFLASFFYRNFGITKIRLTGGEPLMRKGIDVLIERLIKAGLNVNLTTNGFFLSKFSKFLSECGVKVNVSLDTLNPKKFVEISGIDGLSIVLDGIDKAINEGVKLKINTVLLRGVNDDEIFDLIDFASSNGIEIRFIELMPFTNLWSLYFISEDEVMDKIKEKFKIEFAGFKDTARAYVLDNWIRISFISTVTKPFCDACSRLRLTSDGKLILCMFDKISYPIKEFLRPEIKEAELIEFILKVVKMKPRGFIEIREKRAEFEMVKLGG